MSLTYEDRRMTILNHLEMEGKVQVHHLSEMLNVSTETVRRDLDRLEKEGKLRKVYGGAVKMRMELVEPPFLKRTQMMKSEKTAIGKLAASLVQDGETIMLDNGTTTIEILPERVRMAKEILKRAGLSHRVTVWGPEGLVESWRHFRAAMAFDIATIPPFEAA